MFSRRTVSIRDNLLTKTNLLAIKIMPTIIMIWRRMNLSLIVKSGNRPSLEIDTRPKSHQWVKILEAEVILKQTDKMCPESPKMTEMLTTKTMTIHWVGSSLKSKGLESWYRNSKEGRMFNSAENSCKTLEDFVIILKQIFFFICLLE